MTVGGAQAGRGDGLDPQRGGGCVGGGGGWGRPWGNLGGRQHCLERGLVRGGRRRLGGREVGVGGEPGGFESVRHQGSRGWGLEAGPGGGQHVLVVGGGQGELCPHHEAGHVDTRRGQQLGIEAEVGIQRGRRGWGTRTGHRRGLEVATHEVVIHTGGLGLLLDQ